MPQEGIKRVSEKLQELLDVIKEEAAIETQDIRNEITKSVNEMKGTIEERFVEVSGDVQESMNSTINELQGKALKIQYSLQEKYSQSVGKKNEFVVKTADSLVESIEKLKAKLAGSSDAKK